MKKLLIAFFIFTSCWVNSQCTFNNTLVSTITPTCPGTTTVPCVMGGQYVAVNTTAGNTYTFATCGGAAWDTQITLFNAAGTASVGYNDDGCGLQSTVTYAPATSGVVNVLVDQFSCANNATCATLTVTCTAGGGGGGGGCTSGGGNTTCATADPFCTTTAYNYCNTTGVASLGGGGIYGCLGSSPNPAFYYLNVSTSGNIIIGINQYSTAGTPIDVDYIAWGPFASQAAMCPGLSAANIVSCSYSASASETATITGAVAGQWYMVMITNFSNVSGYVQFSQTGGTGATNCAIVAPCTVTATAGTVACFGGTATITATLTGTPPYTVNVLNSGGTTVATQTGSGTTMSFAGLPAGTYTLNLSAGGPCTNTTTVTITGPAAALSATSSSTNLTCATPCTGTLNAVASGGTPPYTYSWSGGLGTGASKSGVCAGTYTATITDANGCTTTTTRTITAPAPIVITPSSTPTTCFGTATGSVSATATGGTGAITFSWSGGLGSGASIGSVLAGSYTVTATDANGCTATASVTVANGPNVVAGFTVTGNNCQSTNSYNFTNTSTGATTYSWNFGAGATPATSTATNPAGVTYSTTGTHTITLTASNGACSQTFTLTVTTVANPTVAASNTTPPCNSTAGSVSAVGAGGLPAYTYSWSGGLGTGATITPVAPGTYTVTVTDANGCTGTASTTVAAGPTLTLATSSTGATCGASNGSVTAAAVGGGTITYTWYADAAHTIVLGAGATLPSLPAGTYYLQASSTTGCSLAGSAVVNNAAGPTISTVLNSNVTCNGLCNGSGTATFSGVAPLSVVWSNGATTATTNTLCAGSQCATVTDGNGCTASSCITITQPAVLTISLTPTNPLCNASCNGSVTSAVTGGTAPYSYSWTGGATTSNITSKCAGTYTCTVTDSKGCTASATVTLIAPPAITINPAALTQPSCFGLCNGSIIASATGGTGALTYTIPGLGTGPNFTSVCAGTYTLSVVDANGCIATSSMVLTQPAALTVAMSSTNASCTAANGTATATVAGGTGPYSYSWSPGGATTATATALVSGSYTVTVTDSKGCTVTGTVIVGTTAGGTSNASTVANVSCFGGANGSVNVTTTGGTAPFSYLWSPGGATTATVSGLTAGTYTVTVTDANGCNSTSTTTVTQPTALAVAVSSTNVSCNGGANGSATAVASGGTTAYSYLWAPGGSTSATPIGLTAGAYTVTVTDANGCTVTGTTTITQPTAITGTMASLNTKCNGSCDGQATITASGGTGTLTYLWNDPLVQTTSTAFNLCAGLYNVVVTDANGCTYTNNATITQPAVLAGTTVIVDAHCGNPDGSACVTVTGGTLPYTYSWTTGATTNCLTSVVAGAYILTVTDANLCTISVPAVIADLGAPSATILSSTNVSCNGGNNGAATVNAAGGTIPYTILWDVAAASQTTPTASNLTAGTYGVTITDGTGCTASATVTITEPPLLIFNVNTYDPVCFGDCNGSLSAYVVGGTPAYSYSWLNSGGASVGTTDSISAMCDGTYTVNITDANGCTTSGSFTITQPVPVAATLTSTNVLCNAACDGTATITTSAGVAPFSYSWSNGATTSVNTGICAGPISVTVTDNDGCTAAYSGTITEPTVLNVVISASGMVSCSGLCDGFADITITGGTAPYTILWSNGTVTNLNNGLCIGTYTVQVTDANGCTDTTSINIIEPGGLNIVLASTNLLCNSQCIGTATATITGGTLPYTILWDDPALSNTAGITNLCAGFYTISVTDANGCVLSQSVNITQPAVITMSYTSQDANCLQNNGWICASGFGGVAPLTYLWNDPGAQTTPCAQNIFSGCYDVTITDANGCFIDSLICINDISGPTLVINSATDVTCFGYGDGTISVTGSGGSGTLSYSWIDGSGTTISSLTNQTSTTTLSGDTYAITVTDTAGCTASVTQTINEPASFVAAIASQTNVSCFGVCDGTATGITTGGNGGNVYSWTSGTTPTAITTGGLCAGPSTMTVTDANGCTASATVTITEPALLTSNVSGTTDVDCFGNCNGTITTMNAGGTVPYLYSWSGGAGTAANANSLCAGSYTLTVTDNNGCIATTSATINEPTVLTAVAASTDAFCGLCNGTALAQGFGGTTPYAFSWPMGATPSSATNSAICVGTYSVTVTDGNGCAANASITVIDQPGPTVASMTFTPPTCFGDTDGTATITSAGGTGTIGVLWTDPAAQTTNVAVNLIAGNYCATLTDANGCTATQCINVTQPNILTGVADLDQTICYGDSAQVFASGAGGTAPYSITWTTAGMTGAGPIVVTPTITTTYCMFVTDNKGCISATDCATITVNPQLAITAGPDQTICDGQTANITANASGGNGGPYTFTWVDGAGTTVPGLTTGSSTNAAVTPSTTTTYYVTVSDGCTNPNATDSVIINVNPLPTLFVNVVDPDGCTPYVAQFILNTDIGTNFLYDFDCDGTVDLTDISSSATHAYNTPGTYDVCVTAISAAGCSTTVTKPNFVQAYPVPVADFIYDPHITTIYTPEITMNEIATGEILYQWYFGDGTTSTLPTPQHTYADTGTYTISLTVTNAYGCKDSISYPVIIQEQFGLYVPNTFTPDGDGVNDIFKVEGIGLDVTHFTLYVFDRWGELIFEAYTPSDGWDGTHKNAQSKSDVYVWKVKARDFKGIDHDYVGHVTLLR